MPLLGFGSSNKGIEKTYTAPDRSERAKCWEARDGFFDCLNKNNIVDSIRHEVDAKANCGKQLASFDHNCAASWVEYFKKQRVMQDKKDRLLRGMEAEGAVKV